MKDTKVSINYESTAGKQFAINLFVGNGFDLSCGLKSRFSDFFNYIFPNPDYNTMLASNNVIYCLLFICFCWVYEEESRDEWFPRYYINDIKWFDVESFLHDIAYGEVNKTSYSTIFYDFYKNHRNSRFVGFNKRNQLISDIFHRKSEIYGKRGPDVINELFDDDLCSFKKDFSIYLSAQINQEYYDKQKVVLNTIMKAIDIKSIDNIINFNYTRINYECKRNCNIHGSLEDNNIVLGYGDYRSISDSRTSKLESLSKDAQRISLSGDKYSPILYNPKSNASMYIFYGLSLGKQDYQILHSIIEKTDTLNESVFIFVNNRYKNDSIELERYENDKNGRKNQNTWNNFLRSYESVLGIYDKKTITDAMRLNGKVFFVNIAV